MAARSKKTTKKTATNRSGVSSDVDYGVCRGIRDALDQEIMTPRFVSAIVRRWGVSEEEAREAIKSRYESIIADLNLRE